MSVPSQLGQSYLSRVRHLASVSGFEDIVAALSNQGIESTRAYLMTGEGNSAQILNLNTPAQIVSSVTDDHFHLHESIYVFENISPEHIEVLGSAWDIDPSFFLLHALNPGRQYLWTADCFEPVPNYEKFSFINGNFEYHGLNMRSDKELNSLPNYFERHCFRSKWEGVETIISNTNISYYRVEESFYLFLIDAPLNIQKRYDGMPRQLRPSLRLQYASNRGGLQLQPLLELRDKKGLHYSLHESLKILFMHGWQRYLLFNHFYDLNMEGPDIYRHAAFPAAPLCYILSNSISRKNLQYLSQEIRRISFQRNQRSLSRNHETLHDRREDLVAFCKAGLVETITYVPTNVERFLSGLAHYHWPNEDWKQRTATIAHHKILEEALELEKFLMETFQLLMSSISVQDSKLSVKQGQLSNRQSLRATQLTLLASIYVPLSFVTGIFGMNLQELNGSSLSIWVFFVAVVIAAAVTAIIFLVFQMYSTQPQTENDAERVGRSDEAGRESQDSWKTRGRVFRNNRIVEKSMA